MHKTSAAFRAIAALALVLALVAGLFNTGSISAQDSTPAAPPVTDEPTVEVPAEPTEAPVDPTVAPVDPTVAPVETAEPVVTTEPEVGGDAVDGEADEDQGTEGGPAEVDETFDVATDQLEVRVRQEASTDGQNTTVFSVNGVDAAAVGDSNPLSGATIEVRSADSNDLIDSATTGENGLILLDALIEEPFIILDTETGSSATVTVTVGEVETGRTIVTATRLQQDAQVPDSGNEDGFVIAQDTIELRVRTQEDSAGATGVTTFNLGPAAPVEEDPAEAEIGAAQIDDSTPAGLEFSVVTVADNETIDTATAGADGILLLDAPVDEAFVIRDEDTFDESAPITLTADDVAAGRTLISATRTVPVTEGENEGPTGDVLPYPIADDSIELRARFLESADDDGTTLYTEGVDDGTVGGAAVTEGESVPAAGVTFTVLDDVGRVVDQATTDADGVVLLDLPVDQAFTIIEDQNNDESDPFLAFSADDVAAGRFLVTAIISAAIVEDPSDDTGASDDASASASASDDDDASASASASDAASDDASASASASDDDASASASASAGASASDDAASSASASASAIPSFEGEVVENAVVITGAIQESEERAGEYDYFYNFVQADEENDIRLAGENEQEYFVAYFAEDDGDDTTDELIIVDFGFTDADGMVTLDAPADEDYFIFEADDFNSPFGSQSLPAGSVSNFFVVEYVSDIDASAGASASADASSRGSSNPSGGPTQPGASDDDDDNGNGNGNGNGGGAAASNAGTGTGSGATALPNTGAGGSDMGSSMTWALFALLAVVGVAAAGFGLHRRNV